MAEAKKSTRKPKTHCKRGHEMVDGNLVKRLLPSRRCSTCYYDSIHYSTMIYAGGSDYR